MDTLAVTGRADLTDAQRAVLEPLLPRGKGACQNGRTGSSLTGSGNGPGAPWRHVPSAYGPWWAAESAVAGKQGQARALTSAPRVAALASQAAQRRVRDLGEWLPVSGVRQHAHRRC